MYTHISDTFVLCLRPWVSASLYRLSLSLSLSLALSLLSVFLPLLLVRVLFSLFVKLARNALNAPEAAIFAPFPRSVAR